MRRKLTRQEAGRKGGKTTAQRYGAHHMQQIGRKGGAALVAKYGREHMSTIGSKGFATTCTRYYGGVAERALFALAKAGKLHIQWREPEIQGPFSYCLRCDTAFRTYCPNCSPASSRR